MVALLVVTNYDSTGEGAGSRIAARLSSQWVMPYQMQRNARALTEHSPDIVARFDREARFLYVNGAMERLTGIAAPDFLGKRVDEPWAGAAGAAVFARLPLLRDAILGVVACSRPIELEMEVSLPDGKRFMEIRLIPEPDETGQVATVLQMGRDITDRRRSEAALRESEERCRLALDVAAIGTWRYRESSGDILLDARAQAMWAFERAVVLPDEMRARMHPDDRESVEAQFAAARVPGANGSVACEFRIVRPGGEVRWLAMRARMDRRTAGAACADSPSVGTYLDITESRRAANILHRSEERFAAAFRASPIALCITVCATGEFREVNDRFVELFGYERAALVGRTTLELQMHRDAGEREAWLRPLLANGQTLGSHRWIRGKDGRAIEVLTSHVVIDLEGVPHALSFVIDLTESRRAEDALREMQTELAHIARTTIVGELTASIAHEVSQPLAGVVTNAEAGLRWLAATEPDLTEVREALQRIIRDGGRAGEVVARIRSLLKKGSSEKAAVLLGGLIGEITELLEAEARRRQIDFRVQVTPGLPVVMGDRIQLQQVVLNLVMNAFDAFSGSVDRPRRVEIAMKPGPGGSVCVSVEDNGVGIGPGLAERIFAAFYTTKPDGLGMGLAISRSIVDAHGGRLWAESGRDGGARFVLLLPGLGGRL